MTHSLYYLEWVLQWMRHPVGLRLYSGIDACAVPGNWHNKHKYFENTKEFEVGVVLQGSARPGVPAWGKLITAAESLTHKRRLAFSLVSFCQRIAAFPFR